MPLSAVTVGKLANLSSTLIATNSTVVLRRRSVGINVEIRSTDLLAVGADKDIQCAAREAIGHRMLSSAVAVGKLVKQISTLIPTFYRRHPTVVAEVL